MEKPDPVIVIDLFPEERRRLLSLLSGLSEQDWEKPTACVAWTVKDVGLHILGDDLGVISRKRDRFRGLASRGTNIKDWDSLVAHVNEQNEFWVQSTRRISPHLLCDLLEFTGRQLCQCLKSLDPYEIGGAVSWAGPDPAPVWLDIAREFTERWLHQQHIRDAVNKPGLKEPRFLVPALGTFVRALPQTFKDVSASDGTMLRLRITGSSGGEWFLIRRDKKWGLYQDVQGVPGTEVHLDQELAWRLFTKGVHPKEAVQQVTVKGNHSLGLKILEAISIIA